jgi:hypothetical protein
VSQFDIQRPPGRIERLLVPENILRTTIAGLSYGAGREMLCYWVGAESQSAKGSASAIVTTVAFPRINSGFAQFKLLEGQMGLITSWCAKEGLWVLAQVHTHPADEPHSEADECWPASHRDGFFSIVFPFFASMSSVRNPGWRVYESAGGGKWSEILPETKLHVVNEVWFPPAGSRG